MPSSKACRRRAILCISATVVCRMGLIELDHPDSAVSGVRFHKPSGRYVTEVG